MAHDATAQSTLNGTVTPTRDLDARRVRLEPVVDRHVDVIHALEQRLATDQVWSSRGRTRTRQAVISHLIDGTLDPMAMVRRADGRVFGYALAYNVNLVDGVVSIATTTDPDVTTPSLPGEAMAVYIDHLFRTHRLRRIMLESAADTFEQFDAFAKIGTVHGSYVDHDWRNGHHVDRVVVSVSAEQWDAFAHPWLRQFLYGSAPEAGPT